MTIRRMLVLVWLFRIFVINGWGDDISLIRVGESWRFQPGTQEPSQPVQAWRQIDFNDADWLTGPSGFSYVREATQWPTPRNYGSVYLRKQFVMADLAGLRWLVLRLGFQDGVVVYLNGQEVLRRNLTGDPVAFNAFATDTTNYEETQDYDLSEFIPGLRPGTNVLAIQAHCASWNYGAMAVVPELLANFPRGPYLQNMSSNRVQVIWRTPVSADAVVEYGVSPALGQISSSLGPDTNHVVALEQLAPDTVYYYRIRSTAGEVTAVSPVFSFRTFKVAGEISFVVMGDSGYGDLAQFEVARRIREAGGDLVLHTGDVTYFGFEYAHADTRFLSVYGEQMRGEPFFPTMGNHDLYSAQQDRPYLDTFYLPTNNMTGTEHYYSFDHGDVHFVSLFVPLFNQLPDYILAEPSAAEPLGSPQYQWLTNDLAHTAKPWKILLFHVPIRTSGLHSTDDYNINGVPDPEDLQRILMPVICQYGVQLAFNGHDHDFERFAPTNGFHSVVLGSSGNGLYSMNQRDPLSAQYWRTFSLLKIRVQGEQLRIEAIDANGVVFDSMTIQKAVPPRQVWPAAWNTPAMEGLGEAMDGNFIGQTFDLTGTPIPARTGEFSNLGEVFVNNDATNLYLGIHQAMRPPGASLFLFLESGSLPGVKALAGLGNGLLDPDGQGADGLDFLANLSFTNFQPAIGCILGDEMADAQSRSFNSPAAPLATGQGVFHLDNRFSDVPGIRLQQFNSSPENSDPAVNQSAPFEQNADLIKLAIPLSALGGIRFGETIKIGMVVGCAGWDPLTQARELDSGFLGNSLSGSGTGAVVLDGVEVRLATIPVAWDLDGDGLTNQWEEAHGLDPLSAEGINGAAGDPDQDGFLNWREQFAGTDPRDGQSRLRVMAVKTESLDLRLHWPAVVGRAYAIDTATNVLGPFAPLTIPGFPRQATTTNEAITLDGLSDPACFFRVRILP